MKYKRGTLWKWVLLAFPAAGIITGWEYYNKYKIAEEVISVRGSETFLEQYDTKNDGSLGFWDKIRIGSNYDPELGLKQVLGVYDKNLNGVLEPSELVRLREDYDAHRARENQQ